MERKKIVVKPDEGPMPETVDIPEPFKTQVLNAERELDAVIQKHCAGMTRQKKAYVVISFMNSYMTGLGYTGMLGGNNKLGEIMACERNGHTLNENKTGADATDTKGNNVEMKNTVAGANGKTNCKTPSVIRKHGEKAEAYKIRVAAKIKSHGAFEVGHTNPASGITHKYAFDPEFISGLVLHRSKITDENTASVEQVNIGSTVCKKCGLVHRLKKYMELQNEFRAAPADFDFSRLSARVPSQCP